MLLVCNLTVKVRDDQEVIFPVWCLGAESPVAVSAESWEPVGGDASHRSRLGEQAARRHSPGLQDVGREQSPSRGPGPPLSVINERYLPPAKGLL